MRDARSMFQKAFKDAQNGIVGSQVYSTVFIENNDYVKKNEAFKKSDGKTYFYKCIVYTCFVYYIKLNHPGNLHLKNLKNQRIILCKILK